MQADFPHALAFVLVHEGGFSETPGDSGGATFRGITQATYDAWRTDHGLPHQSVRAITDSEVQDIYHGRFWMPVRGDELPRPVAFAVFDWAVNAGPHQAVVTLQKAAGVAADGQFGPHTLAAVLAVEPHVLARKVCDLRLAFYQSLVERKPSQRRFLAGWRRRVHDLKEKMLL